MRTSADPAGREAILILVVEDSPTQAAQLRHTLEDGGYQVTVAANGKQALEAARAERPALVISDVLMPEMDGFTFCRTFKSEPELEATPLVLLTELSSPHDIVEGLACGADCFIRKPYDPGHLKDRVDRIIGGREQRAGSRRRAGAGGAAPPVLHADGRSVPITAERQQILDLLISTYEEAVQLNGELGAAEQALRRSYQALSALYGLAGNLNRAVTEAAVIEAAADGVMDIPGVRAVWIVRREGESGFRRVAARALPGPLLAPGALDGQCTCRRMLLAGELTRSVNVIDCSRLRGAVSAGSGWERHATIPLRAGNEVHGLMNVAGIEDAWSDEAIAMLDGVAHQVGAALERAHLHEHLERKVKERTGALVAALGESSRAEAEARESAGRLRMVVDQLPAIVWSTDRDLRFTSSLGSGLAAANLKPNETVGMSLLEYMGGAEPDDPILAHHRQALAGISSDYEVEWLGRVFLSHIEPLRDASGAIVGVVGVAQDITERKRTEDMIRSLNVELEERVALRTAELAAANKELEAFSYSVSHDLRAPLRAIDGFAKAFLEDHGSTLDGHGKHYLERVCAAAVRMGELIDDLLELSRVTTSEIHRTSVDLGALARGIFAELSAAEPERRVECAVAPDLVVDGDASLLRAMLDNLLRNAWKYTRTRGEARIELGVTNREGSRTYFLRDNGVGFDMAHAGKLFKAFQRLHPAAEFEGTGIGLATVERIVRRHGGRVWAEGSPDKGATFYFTL